MKDHNSSEAPGRLPPPSPGPMNDERRRYTEGVRRYMGTAGY